MADEWNYETNLLWDGGGTSVIGEALPVMLTSGLATFSQADSSLLPGSSGLTVLLERIGLPISTKGAKPSTIKMITGLWPLIFGNVGDLVSIFIGTQLDSPIETPVYLGPYSFIIGVTEFIDTQVTGRYLCIKATSTAIQPWTFASYEVEFTEVGVH